jgi:stage II sporulation protein D
MGVAAAAPSTEQLALIVDGRGAAHGMGLAMDGVQGQARAGWSHSRILDLFYPGTTTSRTGGTIRVGLGDGRELGFRLPGGGTVLGTGPGLPLRIPSGGRVLVRRGPDGFLVRVGGIVRAAQVDEILRSPVPIQLAPTPRPKKATPEPTTTPAGTAPLASSRPVRIVPLGDPALTFVEATGRRYRGTIEVKAGGRTGPLVAVNHVDLETYVAGIAEEKGQGWPAAGLETLAVAARSLAAATMSWYGKNHPYGYDICPTGDCQVYLGYDGEEPAMWAATRATSGRIRTHRGRPVLAMYHGNGGGITESYTKRAGGPPTGPFPYLRSVAYPYARPSTWRVAIPIDAARAALAANGIAVPGAIEGFTVLERGDSPRVRRLRIHGTDGDVETTGVTFQTALGLRSTWFQVHIGRTDEIVYPAVFEGVAAGRALAIDDPLNAAASERSWRVTAVAALLLAISVLSVSASARRRSGAPAP